MNRTAGRSILGSMKRLAVLSLLAPLAVLGSTGPAGAVEPCQGQAPTIVGTFAGTVTGTPGDDVIVTEGASEVEAGDGNDRICITGQEDPNSLWVTVDAGAGNDIVDSTAFLADVLAQLGPGTDAYVGGPGEDEVDTRDSDEVGDTVMTGGGPDRVITGRSGRPVNDTVDLGPGDDYLKLRGLAGSGSMNGGEGRDLAQLTDHSRASWRVDNRRHEATVGEATMLLLGLESFDLDTLRWESLTFVGGAEDERLDLGRYPSARPDGGALVDMGGGDDNLIVGPARLTGPYHGGAGRDQLTIEGNDRADVTKGSIDADLAAGLVRIGSDEVKATSWTDLTLYAFDRSVVRTGAGPNAVVVRGCRATVRLGGGNDLVRLEATDFRCAGRMSSRALTAYGEGGDDTMTGSAGNDRLVGGPGRDTAKGGPGRDVCSAETTAGC